jgi:hypothetical protein
MPTVFVTSRSICGLLFEFERLLIGGHLSDLRFELVRFRIDFARDFQVQLTSPRFERGFLFTESQLGILGLARLALLFGELLAEQAQLLGLGLLRPYFRLLDGGL